MTIEDDQTSPFEFAAVESVRQRVINHFGGILTMSYPSGMDIMYYEAKAPLAKMQRLAKQLGEPVQMAVKFDGDLGNTVFMYLPAKNGVENTPGWAVLKALPSTPDGGWMPALSQTSRNVPTKESLNFHLLFSGAPWRDPIMVVDFGNARCLTGPKASDRVSYLSKICNFNVYGLIDGQIFEAKAGNAQPYTVPSRPVAQLPAVGRALAMVEAAV